MKYNRPYSRARWGTMAKDFEMGVDFHRLRRERLAKAQAAIKARGLGAILCFDFDSIRYVCGTTILELFRDFMIQYCICPAEGKPVLFDSAVPAKRISAPWMEDRMHAPISVLKGALPPETDVPAKFAVALILGVIGARLYHVISSPAGTNIGFQYYIENPIEIL